MDVFDDRDFGSTVVDEHRMKKRRKVTRALSAVEMLRSRRKPVPPKAKDVCLDGMREMLNSMRGPGIVGRRARSHC